MKAPGMTFVRYGIPGVLELIGIVLLLTQDDSVEGFHGWALFTGAALSVLLMNVLFRIGVQGERERDDEDAAREYFDKHGRWPDE
jgi:hypothetical protein